MHQAHGHFDSKGITNAKHKKDYIVFDSGNMLPGSSDDQFRGDSALDGTGYGSEWIDICRQSLGH